MIALEKRKPHDALEIIRDTLQDCPTDSEWHARFSLLLHRHLIWFNERNEDESWAYFEKSIRAFRTMKACCAATKLLIAVEGLKDIIGTKDAKKKLESFLQRESDEKLFAMLILAHLLIEEGRYYVTAKKFLESLVESLAWERDIDWKIVVYIELAEVKRMSG